MRKVSDRPNCCEEGDEYISLRFRSGVCTGYFLEDFEHHGKILYCPFCGKKLDWLDEEKERIE